MKTLTDKEKIELLSKRVHNLQCKLSYIDQLRPLVAMENDWSKKISWEEMSEYAIKWMEQEGIE